MWKSRRDFQGRGEDRENRFSFSYANYAVTGSGYFRTMGIALQPDANLPTPTTKPGRRWAWSTRPLPISISRAPARSAGCSRVALANRISRLWVWSKTATEAIWTSSPRRVFYRRRAVASLDPNLPVSEAKAMEAQIEENLSAQQVDDAADARVCGLGGAAGGHRALRRAGLQRGEAHA